MATGKVHPGWAPCSPVLLELLSAPAHSTRRNAHCSLLHEKGASWPGSLLLCVLGPSLALCSAPACSPRRDAHAHPPQATRFCGSLSMNSNTTLIYFTTTNNNYTNSNNSISCARYPWFMATIYLCFDTRLGLHVIQTKNLKKHGLPAY